MSLKAAVWIGVILGSIIGGYIPSIFGASLFSYWGILTSGLGSIIGIFIAVKLIS